MSGFAAVVPTRPAISVLGGSATSSAPAFPSSCAAATAAAAAVRGRGDDCSCAITVVKTSHLLIFVLYYNCTIGDIVAIILCDNQHQCNLSTAIPTIGNNETFFDSPLRGNFGPTSATGSASPTLSSTHYWRERLCGAEVMKRTASLQKPPKASFQGCQGFIGLISVSGAAAEESTTADAVG